MPNMWSEARLIGMTVAGVDGHAWQRWMDGLEPTKPSEQVTGGALRRWRLQSFLRNRHVPARKIKMID